MSVRILLLAAVGLAALVAVAPAASAAMVPNWPFPNGGDVCVQGTTCTPELLPYDCNVSLLLPGARCNPG